MGKVKTVAFVEILFETIRLLKMNVLPLIVNTVLFFPALCVPYINLGACAGMVSLPAKMAKGEKIDPLEIFKSEYRKGFNELFIVFAAMSAIYYLTTKAVTASRKFVIFWHGGYYGRLAAIVAILIAVNFGVFFVSWMLAPILVKDKDVKALDALSQSSEYMCGNRLLFALFGVVYGLAVWVIVSIIALIPHMHVIKFPVFAVLFTPVLLCMQSYCYRMFVIDADSEKTDADVSEKCDNDSSNEVIPEIL